ncbi:hypothetical protein AJ80_03964 [Polytolypa hystricis UAMH7299]|uniref:YMC020W-like alpha/beta hydrolase domain-containing protein n=1 Tax=Polytolypa hystricis (strain UAMH7299) TaxID=1447883 RepID=A0A2B7YEK2_POLH7|nr:hypothetical protein AJ80_03964 [Polytolypa hystricis UAMH7299]
MAPTRSPKRVKPNHSEVDLHPCPADRDASSTADAVTNTSGDKSPDRRRENTSSWYTKSWPRRPKAAAVTEVARESISANSTPNNHERSPSRAILPSSSNRSIRSGSIDLIKKGGSSTRSLPADVATTRINIASVGSVSVPDIPTSLTVDPTPRKNEPPIGNNGSTSSLAAEVKAEADNKEADANGEADNSTTNAPTVETESPSQPVTQSSGWLGWLSRPTTTTTITTQTQEPPAPSESAEPSQPQTTSHDVKDPVVNAEAKAIEQPNTQADQEPSEPPVSSSATKRSWLQMWGGSTSVPQQVEGQQKDSSMDSAADTPDVADSAPEAGPATLETGSTEPAQQDDDGKPADVPNTSRSSGWLFWPSSTKPAEQTSKQEPPEESTRTQSVSQNSSGTTITVTGPGASASATKIEPKKPTPEGDARAKQNIEPAPPSTLTPNKSKTSTPPGTKVAQALPSQLLPAIKDTLPKPERPGIIGQLGRLLYHNKDSEPKHVCLVHDPPRVKKALAIGIHGYFPVPLLRTVIGQPTGTSVKFATLTEKAIREWTEAQGCSCEIERIALEGEGRIEERVDILWKLLLNWIEDIRQADFIMISCHSQGVPVATMLVAKLIAFGCLNSARIGICAMAGVNLGPFPDYRSRWISGSAGELFDFANPSSKVSNDYIVALETVLKFGVRVVYVGSIDDQLVSMESSVFASVSHPYIYRAVFVDGRVHTPSFLSHLVGFAMKLRNLGMSDHGLIRELSSPLAGSLYSGEGHSRLYDDDSVYRLAVEYTLESSPVPNPTLEIHKYHRSQTPNPYILPFAMRGVLEEDYVRRQLSHETAKLLDLFDEWKPSSKVLKDVKFRLEGIRSKL